MESFADRSKNAPRTIRGSFAWGMEGKGREEEWRVWGVAPLHRHLGDSSAPTGQTAPTQPASMHAPQAARRWAL